MNIKSFYPKTGRDLRIQYPELSSIPEFKKLKGSKEMLFVWYWANATSPLNDDSAENLSYKQRINKCLELSGWKPSGEIVKAMYEDSWPDEVKFACSRMERFETDVRNRARIVIKKILSNFEKLADVSEDQFVKVEKINEGSENESEVKSIDFGARKQYVDYAQKIAEALPGLIKNAEEGFGTDDEGGELGTGKKAIDVWHEANKGK